MRKKQWDSIWVNAKVATFKERYGLIEKAVLAVKEGKIAWLASMEELSSSPEQLAHEVHDVEGACITPGWVDCHTHVVYAGNRAHEFELRLRGMSYEEIAKQGGGIQSTVAATRKASEEELLRESLPRVKALIQSGVTTLEIKSGYGLDFATELKILRVAKRIEEQLLITIRKTFLGAHTVPPEYKNNPDDYVDLVCHQMIPEIAKEKLADAVDVFCEKIAFNLAQTEKIFKTAQQYGLGIKCHAEQLSASGAAALAAKYHALSVDHLEYLTLEGVKALAQAKTVAVLLPGAFYFLCETKMPPIDLLREYQVPIALASDCNPGTSPILSMLLILNMACTLFKLTPLEAFVGVTQHAARALGLQEMYGDLQIGKSADFAIWNVSHPVELVYYAGWNPLQQLIKKGQRVN